MLEDVVAMGATTVALGSDAQLDLDERVDLSGVLGSITAPTLVIGAEQDRWVDVSHSHALGSAIHGSQVETLPFGHLVIQEGAAEVATLLHAHASAA
jgi:pimeloyl-ACP methyl ester carboxylesterase